MKGVVIFMQAVDSLFKGASLPSYKVVMAVFVEVLPLPLASEARTFSKSGCVQSAIMLDGARVRYEIFS